MPGSEYPGRAKVKNPSEGRPRRGRTSVPAKGKGRTRESLMEKALLLTIKLDHHKDTWDVVERQRELKELALTAGAEAVQEEACHRPSPTAHLYAGEGKVEEWARLAASEKIDVAIFNNDLTGTQHRNLEKALGTKVIDRTQLILDIFARRARSPEGKAQVELAQLEYLLPRLAGKGVALSRLGGGIGTRGPGEQKLEEDRRRIRDRIVALKRDLEDLKLRRSSLRARREEVSVPTVALVGYTSAGKSTLFNALTGSEQAISMGLFTTLDPLSRAILLRNNQKVVLSDTVGFIRDLPPHLIEAFQATLEEIAESDLLLHVCDISAPRAREHFEAVEKVLGDIGAFQKKTIVVLNKIDLIEEPSWVERYLKEYEGSVAVSALKRRNFDLLLDRMAQGLLGHSRVIDLVLDGDRMDLVDLAYREGKVEEVVYGEQIRLRAVLPALIADKLEKLARHGRPSKEIN